MKITRLSALAILVAVVVTVLVLAQKLLIPLVVAMGVWFLVNAIANGIGRVPRVGSKISVGLRKAVASTMILGFIWISVEIIISSVNSMVAQAPVYQTKLNGYIQELLGYFGQDQLPSLSEFLQGVDLQPMISGLGGTISAFAGDFFLVILYTVFLLLEQGTFSNKWRAMFASDERHRMSSATLDRVSASIREYALVKTGTNLATALLCLFVMLGAGQDFALFWAFLIFLLNFIPTFGSIVAVCMPTMFAFLQFEGWGTAGIVLLGICLAHGVIGYMVEPRLMGRTLNISPLVILISLSIWGMIWGVIGMILAVPIMVSLMIILGAIPYTRPVAVWLSADGLQEKDLLNDDH